MFLTKLLENDKYIFRHLENTIINDHFNIRKIENATDYQKKQRAIDNIPAEFIKHCKSMLSQPINDVLNDMINKWKFPQCWAERRVVQSTNPEGKYTIKTIEELPYFLYQIKVSKSLFINELVLLMRLSFKVDPCKKTKDSRQFIHYKWIWAKKNGTE